MSTKKKRKTEFESIVMLLQGGGALGAYQAGVYEALYEAELEPDWVGGISIGAFNAAIIAGNESKNRVHKLREFWETITMDDLNYMPSIFKALLTKNDDEHQALDIASSMRALTSGVQGFYKPRMTMPWFAQKGTLGATSIYETKQLKDTLESLIDFDLINSGATKINIGAVNVMTGDFNTFCNTDISITVEHVMASGALPPGLPAVQIGDDYFWDGGLISNTPLQWLVENNITEDTLVFQVDLWSADGDFPQNMAEVFTRQKDIQFSSRTRANTDSFTERHELRHAIASLLGKLPKNLQDSPEAKLLAKQSDTNLFNIVHLIYHNQSYEGYSKDFEFSRLSMNEHWRAGYEDTLKTLAHTEVLHKPRNKAGISIYDFSKDNKQRKHSKLALG